MQNRKRNGFATITAYDYSFAKLFAEEGINVMPDRRFVRDDGRLRT
jgi:ketopantoate hydroxymethyltransferase